MERSGADSFGKTVPCLPPPFRSMLVPGPPPPGRAAAGVALPQDEPPAASTACAAREKPDEAAFRRLHAGILASAPEATPWKGRRILAVDGSRITLPRELAERGCRVAEGAHPPRGMVSVPCRLRDRIPVDFDLFHHENERTRTAPRRAT